MLPDFLYTFFDNAFVLLSAVVLGVAAVPWLVALVLPVLAIFYVVQAIRVNWLESNLL